MIEIQNNIKKVIIDLVLRQSYGASLPQRKRRCSTYVIYEIWKNSLRTRVGLLPPYTQQPVKENQESRATGIPSFSYWRTTSTETNFMEALKTMKLFAVMLVMMMVVSAFSVTVSAADAPAPAPTAGASTVFVPTAIASLSAVVFAFLF
ncbi:unnamed protein product [Lactuca saligna]|uniref:Arabinogalactan peptide n=1 Tax=Lactuca saligna TaxID=75948 RepID=A0AA36EE09_LACSI|nr:unnamed protein product [Lactuca saligna]